MGGNTRLANIFSLNDELVDIVGIYWNCIHCPMSRKGVAASEKPPNILHFFVRAHTNNEGAALKPLLFNGHILSDPVI
jgi:hypothetical protein